MRPHKFLLAVSVGLALGPVGCVRPPKGVALPTLQERAASTTGSFVELEMGLSVVRGELIAIASHAIHVRTDDGKLLALPPQQVTRAVLWSHQPNGYAGAWAFFGVLSTFSHGFLLLATTPIWSLSGGLASNADRKAPRLVYPSDGWPEFVPWARFPQGLPLGVTEAVLNGVAPADRAPPALQPPGMQGLPLPTPPTPPTPPTAPSAGPPGATHPPTQ